MTVKESNARIAIVIEKEIREVIKELAKAEDRSESNYVARVMRDHVNKLRAEGRIK